MTVKQQEWSMINPTFFLHLKSKGKGRGRSDQSLKEDPVKWC